MTSQARIKKRKTKTRAAAQVGPFSCRLDNDGCDDTWDIIDLTTGQVVTSIPLWDDDEEWSRRAEATARMFTTSPEMLSSLRELVAGWSDAEVDRDHEAVGRTAAVIAKATGTMNADLPIRFDAYEVHGVKRYHDGADSFCEQVDDGGADFWSLYGHIPGRGAQCIGDFRTREAAEEVYTRITGELYGRSV
jgi:hypothetical protein